MNDQEILITGANGQLGKALSGQYPRAKMTDSSDLDITDFHALNVFDWSDIKIVINAAAYTNVDGAETSEGRELAYKANDQAVGYLSEITRSKGIILVHISSDYVFDGNKKIHTEDELPSPLGVYGKSKAAGDEKAARAPKHYIVRTSWVIGDGKNFVRTMIGLGQKGIAPTVVADQIGRPTFTTELARAIDHLLTKQAEYGTYNVSNEGRPVNWADLTRRIFEFAGFDLMVTDTTTEMYFASKPNIAPRPLNSLLDLSKIEASGFTPDDWEDNLRQYIKKELER